VLQIKRSCRQIRHRLRAKWGQEAINGLGGFRIENLEFENGASAALRPPPNELSNLIGHDVICNCFNRMIPGRKKGFACVLWFFRTGF